MRFKISTFTTKQPKMTGEKDLNIDLPSHRYRGSGFRCGPLHCPHRCCSPVLIGPNTLSEKFGGCQFSQQDRLGIVIIAIITLIIVILIVILLPTVIIIIIIIIINIIICSNNLNHRYDKRTIAITSDKKEVRRYVNKRKDVRSWGVSLL